MSTSSETGYITAYKYKSDDALNDSPCKTVHNYYQWVPYVLVNIKLKHALNNKMAQPRIKFLRWWWLFVVCAPFSLKVSIIN